MLKLCDNLVTWCNVVINYVTLQLICTMTEPIVTEAADVLLSFTIMKLLF